MIQGAETSGRIQSYLKAYSQGTEAWFPDSKDCWILGKLTEKNVDDNAVELTFSILGKKQVHGFSISLCCYILILLILKV